MPKINACLACGSTQRYPIYNPENQPLAALSLPRSQQEAIASPRYPLEFYACALCGHVYNGAFDYSKVPYQQDSNRMYNSGSGWQVYIQEMIGRLHGKFDFTGYTVLEIGCGNGHFLTSLRQKIPSLRCIGFEPGIDPQNIEDKGLEIVNDYFVPERDLPRFRPDLLVCRHVLEHLDAPRDFVAGITYWGNMHGMLPYLLAEVPCIDKAIAQARINDYLYEHVSNFTAGSFRTMLELAHYDIHEYGTAYDDEVLITLAKPRAMPQLAGIRHASQTCHDAIAAQRDTVYQSLEKLRVRGKKIAFWGGTGKGASFLNGFGIKYTEFPLVVDSDKHKTGRFVPGTGQEILPPEHLLQSPADVIVITTQWRAMDICDEIKRRGIACGEIYVVRNGILEKLD